MYHCNFCGEDFKELFTAGKVNTLEPMNITKVCPFCHKDNWDAIEPEKFNVPKNPYIKGTQQYVDWDNGFYRLQEKLTIPQIVEKYGDFIRQTDIDELLKLANMPEKSESAINAVIVAEHSAKQDSKDAIRDDAIEDTLEWIVRKWGLTPDEKDWIKERLDFVFDLGKGVGRIEIIEENLRRLK